MAQILWDYDRPAELVIDFFTQTAGLGGFAVDDENLARRKIKTREPGQSLVVIGVGRKTGNVFDLSPDRDELPVNFYVLGAF